MKPGTQIAYIPDHADDNILHPDVEFGFVTHIVGDTVFCRYWSKYSPGELRTKMNSEGAYRRNIIEYDSQPQIKVNKVLREIQENRE